MANKIETLATEMGVTTGDVEGFVAALDVWIRKGFTFEQAVAANLRQMTRLAANSLDLIPDLKPVAADWVYDAHSAQAQA